jgi:hypothetical protein
MQIADFAVRRGSSFGGTRACALGARRARFDVQGDAAKMPPGGQAKMDGAQTYKTHWTKIRLHAADGYGLVSSWDAQRSAAVVLRDGEPFACDARTTAEHVRALKELRDCDTCANWFTDVALEGAGPRRDAIDWTGFPERSEPAR